MEKDAIDNAWDAMGYNEDEYAARALEEQFYDD